MKLGTIIVTYNRISLLKECIEACISQSVKFEKIFVVNNASTDGTTEYLEQLNAENIEIITLAENLGGAGGFYKGIELAQKHDLDYVLLIDDDAILDCNYNQEIVKYMQQDNNIFAYSGTVKTNNEIQFGHRRHLSKKFKEIDSISEDYDGYYFDYDLATFCGLFISVDIIRKIGLPCKDFFIWYDDTEYSLRIKQFTKIRNINNAWLKHKTSINDNKGITWKTYYGLRNQIITIKKYFPKHILLKNILQIYKMIIGGKILRIVKKDMYYDKLSDLHKDALRDGLDNNTGKNSKYVPGVKFEKKK